MFIMKHNQCDGSNLRPVECAAEDADAGPVKDEGDERGVGHAGDALVAAGLLPAGVVRHHGPGSRAHGRRCLSDDFQRLSLYHSISIIEVPLDTDRLLLFVLSFETIFPVTLRGKPRVSLR